LSCEAHGDGSAGYVDANTWHVVEPDCGPDEVGQLPCANQERQHPVGTGDRPLGSRRQPAAVGDQHDIRRQHLQQPAHVPGGHRRDELVNNGLLFGEVYLHPRSARRHIRTGSASRQMEAARISLGGPPAPRVDGLQFKLCPRPARLLAIMCLNMAVRAGALTVSPRRTATVRAYLLLWPLVMIPSGSEGMSPPS
jgi:hypothetical protein